MANLSYKLIDSGDGEKLERFGDFLLDRPDPQVLWHKHLPENEWKKADARFTRDGQEGKWDKKPTLPAKWVIEHGGIKFWIKPTAFKHTGIFPEQVVNWDWTRTIITAAKAASPERDVEVLNLFGYTGGASLACAQIGAKVVHVDGSKSAITWAKENAELSGLSDKPIRWILEDARLFAERELKRGRTYQGIIMDPPAFGHGANKELWKIEEHLLPLVELCTKLLAPDALFFIINGYSAGYSPIAYQNILADIKASRGGTIEIGELTLREDSGDASPVIPAVPGRLLPCGIFARWKK